MMASGKAESSLEESASSSAHQKGFSKVPDRVGSVGSKPHDGTAVTQGAQGLRHQRFVLADPVAFSYLEEDPGVVILDRARWLEGYQCYVVEQWACSRSHPTFVVIAYTGDLSNKIKVGVLSVPADEAFWSPRLKVYFRVLSQYHARQRDTALGTILVTNLSGFPSSLTLINIPDGDVRKHREDFVVNENLKRMGCSGRVGISIAPPTVAAEAKFYQLYRTSEKVDLYKSVIELVKLSQAALMLFDVLRPEYADGLLCDITEKATNDWWTEFGYSYYKTEPADGILGPTTVSALLGTLIGARNRLHVLSTPIAKDVFNIEMTKRAIGHFQKTVHLPRTRRLDHKTLDNLYEVTAKQASADGWIVPRAVKSTVAELSGKGGEMVMDMVGRDRATLAEIETTDIERFAQLVRGERAKWLWQGRPRRRTTRDLFDEHPGQITTRVNDDLGVASPRDDQHDSQAMPDQQPPRTSYQKHARLPTTEAADPRKTVLQRATGRFRGPTFSRKAHQSKASKDVRDIVNANKSFDSLHSAKSQQTNTNDSPVDHPDNIFDEYAKEQETNHDESRQESGPRAHSVPRLSYNPAHAEKSAPSTITEATDGFHNRQEQNINNPFDVRKLDQRASTVVDTELSIAQDVDEETDVEDLPQDKRPGQSTGLLLQRTQSLSNFEERATEERSIHRWPRQISFGVVEEAIFANQRLEHKENEPHQVHGTNNDSSVSPGSYAEGLDLFKSTSSLLMTEKEAEQRQRTLRHELGVLGRTAGCWLVSQVDEVSTIEAIVTQDAEQMHQLYAPRKEEQRALGDASQEVLKEQRARLAESVRDLETLGQRVEYEIEGLQSKVEDMEDSVGEFEKQVTFVEDRVKELWKGSEKWEKAKVEARGDCAMDESWSEWLKKILAGTRSQKDVSTMVKTAIGNTRSEVEEVVKDAREIDPLEPAPSESEMRMQEEALKGG